MKQIKLANGTILEALDVVGKKCVVQGTSRDTLTFLFSSNEGLEYLDGLFTEANCERIIITDETGEYIYKGYTICVELKKADVVAEQETSESEAVTVKRVTVSMAQRTYAETKLAQVAAESTNTQLAVAELAEIVVGGAE